MAEELTFGVLLREVRKRRGLSQAALAALLRAEPGGVKRSGHAKVSEWERDTSRPRDVAGLAVALEVKGAEKGRFFRLAAVPAAPRAKAQAPPG